MVSAGDQARPSPLLDAERGPAEVLIDVLQELRAREASGLPTELGSVAALPLQHAVRRHGRVSRSGRAGSSWLMASGMESSHRGFAGTVEGPQRQGAAGPPGGGVDRFARAAAAGTSTRRPTRLCPAWAG